MTTRKTERTDKRAAILDAALTEFAAVGFVRASTNAIADAAGVAKGLVFHHFGSKEELFLAVADDVNAAMTARFMKELEDPPRDLFARVLRWTDVKLALVKEDPRRLRFYIGALVQAPEDIQRQTRERAAELARVMIPRLLEGIDLSALRPGVSLEDAIEAFSVIGAGLERMMLPLLTGRTPPEDVLPALTARSKRLLELLRDGLYRPDR